MRHASYLQTEEKLTLLAVTVSNTETKTTLALIWNIKKNETLAYQRSTGCGLNGSKCTVLPLG